MGKIEVGSDFTGTNHLLKQPQNNEVVPNEMSQRSEQNKRLGFGLLCITSRLDWTDFTL